MQPFHLAALTLASIAVSLSAAPPPAVLFTDVESGPVTGGPNNLGTPISLFGTGFGAMRGASKVTIGGVEAAAYAVWGSHNPYNKTLDMIVVQPGPASKGGPIVVTVDGKSSNANHTFTVNKGKIHTLKPGDDVLAAIKKAGAGDTILLRGGTYRDGELWVRRVEGDSGKPGGNKTLKNYPGEEVIFNNRQRPFIVSADYITVSGLKFLNGKSIGITEEGDQGRLRGNKFVNNYGTGDLDYAFMDSHGDGHTLAGNVCEAASSTQGTQGHCFYISYGDGVKLLWNVASGAPGYGIHVFDQRRQAGDFRRTITNLLIEGNIMKNSTERSGLILTMGDEDKLGNGIDGVMVRNNIFTGNNHAGLVVGDFARNVKIYNNTFYQNGKVELWVEERKPVAGYEVRNNLFYHSKNQMCKSNCTWYPDGHVQFTGGSGKSVALSNNGFFPSGQAVFNGTNDGAASVGITGAVTGSVQFVDPAAFDFRVKPGAAVINRSAALAGVTNDYNGVVRPQDGAIDIGAFEFTPE